MAVASDEACRDTYAVRRGGQVSEPSMAVESCDTASRAVGGGETYLKLFGMV